MVESRAAEAGKTRRQRIPYASAEDIPELLGELEQIRKQGDWSRFADNASYLRIASPQNAIQPTAAEWNAMREELQDLREPLAGTVGQFVRMAAAMKILAAHDVKVTDNGIEITMNKSKDSERSAPIPEPLQL
jgi:hypothetical protein